MSEQKVDAVLTEAASVAGAVALIPTPASPALLLFSEIEPIIGPEIVHLFASLFGRLKRSKNPKAAALTVVSAGHAAMDTVALVDNIDPDGEGRDV